MDILKFIVYGGMHPYAYFYYALRKMQSNPPERHKDFISTFFTTNSRLQGMRPHFACLYLFQLSCFFKPASQAVFFESLHFFN